jgi:hypothetical protein
MKLFYKIFIGLAISAIIIIIGFFILLGSVFGSDDMCGNEIIQTEYSPNKEYKIVTFTRNCGATTDFSSHISILKSDELLENESGNVFSGDSNHGLAKTDSKNLITIKSKWLSNDKVEIVFDENVRVFDKDNSVNNVDVEFKN